jgi:hypothetical protein
MSRPHHRVYVVELDPAVLEEKRFREANTGRDPAKPCVYVGMTGLDPDLRFDKHKAGIQANRFAFEYGPCLLILLPAQRVALAGPAAGHRPRTRSAPQPQ